MSTKLINCLQRKTPLEEKIDALGYAFETLVDLVLKIPDSFDNNIKELFNRISVMELKLSEIDEKMNYYKGKSETPLKDHQLQPPPPNQVKKKPVLNNPRTSNPRADIIKELRAVFEKRKELDEKKK